MRHDDQRGRHVLHAAQIKAMVALRGAPGAGTQANDTFVLAAQGIVAGLGHMA